MTTDAQERFTAGTVATRNADLVGAALAQAGVDPVRFADTSSLREIVAIRQEDLPRAREALTSLEPGLAAERAGAAVSLGEGLAALERDPSGTVLRLYRPVGDPTGNLVLGGDLGCELQVWAPYPGPGEAAGPGAAPTHYQAPRPTPYGRWFAAGVFDPGVPWTPPAPVDAVDFPIDVVYTWVDDTDPTWAAQRDAAMREAGRLPVHASSVGAARYRNRDELRYSLRSLELFAPFVRHVFLVTADQVPDWLVADPDRLTVVPHRDIFADPANLPTFNSHSIEAHLHRIEGLAEHYLYLNDDVIFGRPVHPRLFFEPNGLHRFFLSRAQIPYGPTREDDIGIDAAAKNGRRLLEEAFGRRVTQKFKHGPHAQRRSLLAEVGQRFPEQVRATAASRFRHPDDYSVPASLAHHYAYLQGLALPGELRYDYIHLADLERTEQRFAALLAERDRDAVCINDSDVGPEAEARVDELVHDFLERYLPVPSSFERA